MVIKMKEMLIFEWKKIFARRFNVIAMALGYLLIGICTFNYITQENFWDEETGEYVYGVAAYELGREKAEKTTDYLTEEFLTELTKTVQAKGIDLDSDEGYSQVIKPVGPELILLLSDMYTDMGDAFSWGKVGEISTEGGIHFYEHRIERIRDYLNLDFSYGNYSEAEKEFWLDKAKQVQTPFVWGDRRAMDTLWLTIEITFYLLFVICICISPVFAAEYESGAAALLLTTKKGKTKLTTAKILAAVIFTLSYMIIGIGMAVLAQGVIVGFTGTDLPIQLWGVEIPYDLSMGEVCMLTFMVMLLIALAITLLTLAWSSRLKSTIIALVLGFALIIGPSFFPMSKTSGLWNHINYLFPVRAINVKDVLRTYNSYQFGNVVISYLGMIVLVYALVSLVSLLRIRGGFAKHQVK